MKRSYLPFVIIGAVLLVDQALKFWIKTNMFLGQEFVIADWFRIHFLENPGMAFGLSFGSGSVGKLTLSVLRLVVVVGIGWYVYDLVRKNEKRWMIASVSLVVAGALGNIIDGCFYGMIFDSGTIFDQGVERFVGYVGVSQLSSSGYAPFFHGCVVDMFYFPLFEGTYPQWFPKVGGEHFLFFRPVFNIADAAITGGVILFLILQINWRPSAK